MKQQIKILLKKRLLHPIRRVKTLVKWHRTSYGGTPVVFGNAMPKSGSKLLKQILHGMTELAPLVDNSSGPIRTITMDGRTRSQAEICRDLARLRHGDLSLGYLHATPENQTYLNRPDWASYFIYRDPRDLLISHIFYAVDINPNHGMHEYYLPLSMEERLRSAIRGVNQGKFHLPTVGTRYERILGWMDCQTVLKIRFEELIQERERKLEAILAHFEAAGGKLTMPITQAVGMLEDAMDPKKSPTFRTGKSGGWREHFSDDNKQLFKEYTGDLLIRLGYEEDDSW